MSKVGPNSLHLIGSTPIHSLKGISSLQEFQCHIYAKLENHNPTGSACDRIVRELIEEAENAGYIHDGVSVICGGSGNLCLSAAWVCSVKGHRCIIVPQMDTTPETHLKLKALGATVIKLPFYNLVKNNAHANVKMVEAKVNELCNMIEPIWLLDPSRTNKGIDIHCKTTAEEIIKEVASPIDMIICANESYGIFDGISKKFIENQNRKPEILEVSLEKNHFYFPEIVQEEYRENRSNELIESSDAEAYVMTRRLHREEGVLVGAKAGAVLDSALKAIEKYGLKDKPEATIVVVIDGSLWNSNKEFLSISWMVKNSYYKETKMESLYWWYDMPLMDIKMDKSIVIDGSVPIWKAIDILSTSKADKCVAVNTTENIILGIALKYRLLSTIRKGIVTKDDNLESGTISKGFTTVDIHENIRDVEENIHGNCWAIVTQTLEKCSERRTKVLGVFTQTAHIVHLLKLEEFHKVYYNITMTDGIPCYMWFLTDYNATS